MNSRALCLYLLIVATWRRAVSCALAVMHQKVLVLLLFIPLIIGCSWGNDSTEVQANLSHILCDTEYPAIITKDGRLIAVLRDYRAASDFSEGYGVIRKYSSEEDFTNYIVDSKGRIKPIGFPGEKFREFNGGISTGQRHAIDTDGKVLIELDADSEFLTSFFEERALIRIDKIRSEGGGEFFIDTTGRAITPNDISASNAILDTHTFYSRFHDGLAWIGGYGETEYLDREGRVVIPYRKDRHHYLDLYSEGLVAYSDSESGLRGYIDANGDVKIPAQYDTASHFSEGLAGVEKDGKFFYIDKAGNKVLDLPDGYIYGLPFSCGYARIEKESYRNYNFINRKGKLLFDAPLSYAQCFQDDVAWIENGSNAELIDLNGKTILADFVHHCDPMFFVENLLFEGGFTHGLYPQCFSNGYAFVSFNGIPYSLLSQPDISCSALSRIANQIPVDARLRRYYYGAVGKLGYRSVDGTMAIEPKYERTHCFRFGWAVVAESEANEKYGVINSQGEWVVEPKYEEYCMPYKNYILMADLLGYSESNVMYLFNLKTRKRVRLPLVINHDVLFDGPIAFEPPGTYCDFDGKVFKLGEFTYASSFSEGIAAIKRSEESGWMLIDLKGKPIVNKEFEYTGYCVNGVIPVEYNGKWGVLNKKGQVVLAPTYAHITNFYEGTAIVTDEEGRNGAIDVHGRLVIPIARHNLYRSIDRW